VGDLLVETCLANSTPGTALGSIMARRLSMIEASGLELLMSPEIDDYRRHKTCTPNE
jgi:hypothetical protein